MMRLRDAAILAGTKLRTRKTRTIVTAVLASLLFAALVFACTVVKGGIDSYARYSKNGLSQRYITNVFYFSGMGLDYSSPTLIAAAKEQNKLVIAEKKADAKRLGVDYDAATEPSVTLTDGQGGTGEYLNTQNYAVQQVIGAELAKEATPAARTNAISAAYHPTQIYETKVFGDTTNLKIMESGKESFTTNTKNRVIYGNDPLTTLSYVSRDLVGSFLLDNADLTPAKTPADAVPVIVTFSNAEKALGLKALPNTATNAERLARIQEVKRRAANATVTACYRNSSSAQAIETAKQQLAEREKRKNDRTYQQPSQLYALPDASSCGAVVVTKDTRSVEEKRLAAKQHEFNVKYNIEIEPVQKKLTFRIVGLSADTPDYANMSTFDNLAMLLGGSSLMGQWVIPSEFVDESIRGEFIPQGSPGDVSTWYSTGVLGTLVEFGSPADAKRFLTEQNCNMECSSKPVITFFGSNSVLIEDLMNNAAFVLRIAGGVVSIIAAFLMMGMVGRVITDSRRETAVFRAIGAKRNDIRLIYTLYVLAFSLIIVAVAMAIGFAVASLYSASVVDSLTTSARLMFIETKEPGAFILLGVWPEALALTVCIIMLAGLVSTVVPLGRNLVRSPLKDMRDE
jgi:hypothetical protein